MLISGNEHNCGDFADFVSGDKKTVTRGLGTVGVQSCTTSGSLAITPIGNKNPPFRANRSKITLKISFREDGVFITASTGRAETSKMSFKPQEKNKRISDYDAHLGFNLV